jgi:hypothetical protein
MTTEDSCRLADHLHRLVLTAVLKQLEDACVCPGDKIQFTFIFHTRRSTTGKLEFFEPPSEGEKTVTLTCPHCGSETTAQAVKK